MKGAPVLIGLALGLGMIAAALLRDTAWVVGE